MRGRKPRPLTIGPDDRAALQQILRSRCRPAYQIQRALILLGIVAGERVASVATLARCDFATVWRVCRRFEALGMPSVTTLAMPPAAKSEVGRPDEATEQAGVAQLI